MSANHDEQSLLKTQGISERQLAIASLVAYLAYEREVVEKLASNYQTIFGGAFTQWLRLSPLNNDVLYIYVPTEQQFFAGIAGTTRPTQLAIQALASTTYQALPGRTLALRIYLNAAESLLEQLSKNTAHPAVITGHSLGGATATCVKLLGTDATCISFASPKVLAAFPAWLHKFINVLLPNDPITYWPPPLNPATILPLPPVVTTVLLPTFHARPRLFITYESVFAATMESEPSSHYAAYSEPPKPDTGLFVHSMTTYASVLAFALWDKLPDILKNTYREINELMSDPHKIATPPYKRDSQEPSQPPSFLDKIDPCL